MGWVVNATPRPLYPRERRGTHCIGGWVGPRAGLDRCGKSRVHRDSIRGPSSPQQGAVRIVCLFVKCDCGYRVQRIAIGCSKTSAVGQHEQDVFAIFCLLVKSRLVIMFPRHVCSLQTPSE